MKTGVLRRFYYLLAVSVFFAELDSPSFFEEDESGVLLSFSFVLSFLVDMWLEEFL